MHWSLLWATQDTSMPVPPGPGETPEARPGLASAVRDQATAVSAAVIAGGGGVLAGISVRSAATIGLVAFAVAQLALCVVRWSRH